MTGTTRALAAGAAVLILLLPFAAATPVAQSGGVTFERLLNAADEPHNWLTYSGTYSSQRHTTLDQITPENVDQLELQWVFQAQSLQPFQATPLVVDGMMYTTEAPNTVLAIDAELGRVFWRYELHAGAGVAPLLRADQPRTCDPRQHPLHGHHRRPTARD